MFQKWIGQTPPSWSQAIGISFSYPKCLLMDMLWAQDFQQPNFEKYLQLPLMLQFSRAVGFTS